MSEENIPGKKLNRLTGAKNLSAAIQKLESKKALMEDDLKDDAHYLFENLKPINLLDRTLQNTKDLSSEYSLFKEALAFGAGYLSKRKIIDKLKSALIKTFRIPANATGQNAVLVIEDQKEKKKDEFKQTEKRSKEMNLQNQIEKVKAKPEVLPEPTYWPFFLAMGLAFLGWGLLTTWLISAAGFVIFVISLIGWINILRHE